MVELNSPNVVKMAVKSKQASPALRTKVYDTSDSPDRKCLILTPDFDLVIITTSHQ